MFKNYFRTAFRNLIRNKVFSFLNIAGLSIGIACCFLIMIFVKHEISFDRFHQDADHIYRVVQTTNEGIPWANTGAPMVPNMIKDIPGMETGTRVFFNESLVSYEGPSGLQRFYENGIAYVDTSFFDVFSFELIKGNKKTAFQEPFSLVLTVSIAEKYFGEEDPIGKTLNFGDKFDMRVVGIMADFPQNSHLQADILGSFKSVLPLLGMESFNSWWYPSLFSFVKVAPDIDIQHLNETVLPEFIDQYREKDLGILPVLQAITDIHLYGNPYGEGNIRYVLLFGAIAIMVLLIACINFMNLSTARAATRAREVGIRKVVGAGRTTLVFQFLGESFILTTLAIIVGLGLAELFLPWFNAVADLELTFPWGKAWIWGGILSILVIVSLLSGFYPSVILSGFSPTRVLKSSIAIKTGGGRLRQSLVVFQFSVSIALMICTWIIYSQYQYMVQKPKGYDAEQLVAIQLKETDIRKGFPVLRKSLLEVPDIVSVTATSWIPGGGYTIMYPCEMENDAGEMAEIQPQIMYVDHDFLETLGVSVSEGRDFDPDFPTDENQGFIVNEAAARTMNLPSPLEKSVRMSYGEYGKTIYEKKGKVIGKVEDFLVTNVKMSHGPAFITLANEGEKYYLGYCLMRIRPGKFREVQASITRVWEKTFPNQPMELEYMDQNLAIAYEAESRSGRIFASFSLLAMLIASIGLLGLAVFTTHQRTKEIGIRKILGASAGRIVLLLNKEFTIPVLVAMGIAAPLAYLTMYYWLETYPYAITLKVWPFLVSGLIALAMTWLTVGFLSLKASSINPASALREE